MNKVILIKYGELSTKKDNRNQFLKALKIDLEKKLGNLGVIKYDYGRMFIYTDNISLVKDKLKKVFGIHEYVIAEKIDTKDIEEIKINLINLLKEKEFNTFKVDVKRSDKSYSYDSMELRQIFGSCIIKSIPDLKVDLHNPELTINIEIRLKEVLIYFNGYPGLGGYPNGILGKGMLMLSGGIDSPVSGYLTMKRGVKLEAIYFESPPHTSIDALKKVETLSKILASYNNDFKLHIINFTKIQEEIYKNIPHDYLITIMRRMMYRITAIIASKNNAKVIVNGESIGQVASQTLSSMSAINEVVKIPVIRPLCTYDKLEIIKLAKEIGTYETSILPFEDCCTIFVPDHPIINPSKEKCAYYESLIPYEELIYDAVKNECIKKLDSNDLKYKDLL